MPVTNQALASSVKLISKSQSTIGILEVNSYGSFKREQNGLEYSPKTYR